MSKNIKIGWGRSSIAPDKSIAIPGQFHMRVSLGELNPVTANALAIDNGDDSVIFVAADMVSLRLSILDIIIEKLRKRDPAIPGNKIVFNSTHTHAGPNAAVRNYPCEIEWMEKDEALDFLTDRICDAVVEAWNARKPGSVAYGYGFATVGHSRRVIYLDDLSKRPNIAARPGVSVDGHGKMYGNTNDPMFSHYEAGTDAFINLLYTFDETGKLTGAIVNVPCPAQTNENAWLLHAGFWHPVREKIRAKYGDIGIITQCGAGGDLAPRQLHYKQAEARRYQLKYPEKYKFFAENPLPYPPGFFKNDTEKEHRLDQDLMDRLRAEDIAGRISAAFDEVLEWAQRDKQSAPELRHEVRNVQLERRMFPEDIYKQECKNYEALEKESWQETGSKWADFRENSTLSARRARCLNVKKTYESQSPEPVTVNVHAIRIGEAAFASNPFELFIDFMHRIQARSPFQQTFIVQLAADKAGIASYLATERAIANKGYSASPYCNIVSAAGGQQLVNDTLDMLNALK